VSAESFLAPTTLEEALALVGAEPRPEVLAGGTDLWPLWTSGQRARPSRVLSLHRLAELRQIEELAAQSSGAPPLLRIGGACVHAQLVASPAVRRASPGLAAAAATIGAAQIQNRGTVGGNLVNASPAADLPPPLVAAGAEVELTSRARGARRVPVDRFFRGYRDVDRAPDELLTAVLVPQLAPPARELFRKVGTRRAQAISKVVGSCRLAVADGRVVAAGIAFGSVGPTVVRLEQLERWLVGQAPTAEVAEEAGERAAAAVVPIDDLRSSAAYRRHVVGRLLRGFIHAASS